MSPQHIWTRIARCMAVYGGEFDRRFYKIVINEAPTAVPAIAELQANGSNFKWSGCEHWAVDLCGCFEVTHHAYKPPVGYDTPAASALYSLMDRIFCIEESNDER